MTLEKRIEAFVQLGLYIQKDFINPQNEALHWMEKAEQLNPWFTQEMLGLTFQSLTKVLNNKSLLDWVADYSFPECNPKKVAVIMAGNIPIVGFHDFLSVLISGHKFLGKLSSKDTILLPSLAKKLIEIEPEFDSFIEFTEDQVKDFDAIIATGSNNSARYFESYFGKYPNIIRQNRNSVAIIKGDETEEELKEIAKDIYFYFGLGCRSVNKLYFPNGYKLPHFIDHMQDFENYIHHNKFGNNYSYNNSVLLLNMIPFLDNGFSIFKEDTSFASPISVIHYEFYDDIENVEAQLEKHEKQIQCVVEANNPKKGRISPGQTQFPMLNDYADNVDVMRFLLTLV